MRIPIPSKSGGRMLADWVTDSLRQAIINGAFDNGEKLDLDKIADVLEVSRTPVRDAIKKLETEGFVEIKPRRGAFIPEINRSEIMEIIKIRSLLEPEAIRQATNRIPDSVIDEMEERLVQTRKLIIEGDHLAQYKNDIYIHEIIINFVDMQILKEILTNFANRLMKLRHFAAIQARHSLDVYTDEHEQIIRSLHRRDPEEAAIAMRKHLESTAGQFEKFLNEQNFHE